MLGKVHFLEEGGDFLSDDLPGHKLPFPGHVLRQALLQDLLSLRRTAGMDVQVFP